jgi:muconolactone delta-isomerase
MRFMVQSTPTQALTAETQALIPAESARGQTLDAQGVRLALYVAADFSGAWQVYQVDSLAALMSILESFPLHPYVQYKITPLVDDTR